MFDAGVTGDNFSGSPLDPFSGAFPYMINVGSSLLSPVIICDLESVGHPQGTKRAFPFRGKLVPVM